MDLDSDNFRELTTYTLNEITGRFRTAMKTVSGPRSTGGKTVEKCFTGSLILLSTISVAWSE